jgi:hypothetical protein
VPVTFLRIGNRLINLDRVAEVRLDSSNGEGVWFQFAFVGGTTTVTGPEADAVRRFFAGEPGGRPAKFLVGASGAVVGEVVNLTPAAPAEATR